MASISKPFVWFYHEFGLDSLRETGRDGYLIILARTLRMFAYGTNALILALFFAEIGFSDSRIGLFMTLTLLGDVLLGTFLTLIADKVGRRKILLAGSFLMISTGVLFALFENFWILLFAAVIGVVSATGGDFGPFRSIEESVISQLTTPRTRPDVLAWYVTTSGLGSTAGSELSGRLIEYFQSFDGWSLADAYHALFWIYAVMGIVNAALVLLLSKDCEAKAKEESYAQLPQNESEDNSIELTDRPEQHTTPLRAPVAQPKRWYSWMFSSMGTISPPTLSTMYKLWILLAVDSLSDGMVPYSLTNYYMDNKFHPRKSTLGDITSVSYFLGVIGSMFAGPIARRLGLVNTMVFTHIPSSASVLLFPLPQVLWLTAILLFVRAGLNNLDQAPRSALIAGVVRPEERTAVMGITSMVRTLAATAGPTVTGVLAANNQFWVAFVAGGACRLAYDVGLWVIFVNVKLYQHEQPKPEMAQSATQQERNSLDDVEAAEMESLADSEDSGVRTTKL